MIWRRNELFQTLTTLNIVCLSSTSASQFENPDETRGRSRIEKVDKMTEDADLEFDIFREDEDFTNLAEQQEAERRFLQKLPQIENTLPKFMRKCRSLKDKSIFSLSSSGKICKSKTSKKTGPSDNSKNITMDLELLKL